MVGREVSTDLGQSRSQQHRWVPQAEVRGWERDRLVQWVRRVDDTRSEFVETG